MWKARSSSAIRGIHNKNRTHWAKNYMKARFETVLFNDECLASLNGCNGEERMVLARKPQVLSPRQSGANLSNGICNELVGPFRIADGHNKMTAKVYIGNMKAHLVPVVQ